MIERGKIDTSNTQILEMYFGGIYIAKFGLGIDRISLIYMNIILKTFVFDEFLYKLSLIDTRDKIGKERGSLFSWRYQWFVKNVLLHHALFLKGYRWLLRETAKQSLNMWFPNENQKLKMVTTTVKIKHFYNKIILGKQYKPVIIYIN